MDAIPITMRLSENNPPKTMARAMKKFILKLTEMTTAIPERPESPPSVEPTSDCLAMLDKNDVS
jgi:hypothetical protein